MTFLRMNAIEIINRIRQIHTPVPVIRLSNFVTVNTFRLAFGIECGEILQTPVSPGTLENIFILKIN